MKILKVIYALLLFYPTESISQTWDNSVDNGLIETCYSGIATSSGGYILTGVTKLESTTTNAIMLVKLDNQGENEWTKILNDPSDGIGFGVIETNDGGFAVVARLQIAPGERDVLLVKTDSEGNEEWVKEYMGNDTSNFIRIDAQDIKQTPDEGYIITGFHSVYNQNETNKNFFLLKLNEEGEEEWFKTYGENEFNERGYKVEVVEGGFLITGAKRITGEYYTNLLAIKTDTEGNELWVYERDASPDFTYVPNSIVVSDDGYTIVGNTYSSPSFHKTFVVKLSDDGNQLWDLEFNVPQSTPGLLGGVGCNAHDGGIMTMSIIQSNTNGNFAKPFFAKISDDGEIEWTKVTEGTNDGPKQVKQISSTSDDGYFMAGTRTILGSETNQDFYGLKTDGEGCFFTSDSEEYLSYDIHVFPNPTTDYLFVDFSNSPVKTANLSIFNILGERVLEKEVDSVESIDVSHLTTGLYNYRILIQHTILSKGQIFIKKF